MAKSATITVSWVNRPEDFFNSVVSAVAKALVIREAALFQPVHDPAIAFYRKYSMDHPRANAGEKVTISVSLNQWPGRTPEVTDFTMAEVKTPAAAKLTDNLRKMANGPDFKFGSNYDKVRGEISRASAQEKADALADQTLIALLRGKMTFQDFAKAVELLGRQAPTGDQLMGNPIVTSAMDDAWANSNVGAKNPNDWRENGGYIFMNVVSGQISILKGAQGNWGAMNLPDPELKAIPDDNIVVAIFHTHPNPAGKPGCEDHDTQKSQLDGVPDVVRATKGPFPCGVSRRLHLAGARGYPGPSGGDAP
jgi:hypothetical protein